VADFWGDLGGRGGGDLGGEVVEGSPAHLAAIVPQE